MCYTAKSKKERTKRIASKDILVYKVAALVDNHIEAIVGNYKYFPNVISKHIKLHYKGTTHIYKHIGVDHPFKRHVIGRGYYSYINKEICTNNIPKYFLTWACVKYDNSPVPLVCAECVILKGTKYCVNNMGEVISETIIYTGKYKLLM